MRYVLQVIMMLSDLLLMFMAILCTASVGWQAVPLVGVVFYVWWKQGGFIAWTHRKKFLKNARELGL